MPPIESSDMEMMRKNLRQGVEKRAAVSDERMTPYSAEDAGDDEEREEEERKFTYCEILKNKLADIKNWCKECAEKAKSWLQKLFGG